MARREEVGIDITARNRASRELGQVASSLGMLGDRAETVTGKTSRLGGAFRTLTSGVMMGVGMQAFNMTVGGIGSLGDSIIGMNAQLEKSTLQFETLFRDADRAKSHVAMLFEFAKKTPFETGPIIEASRLLQTFGGDALNTEKNLTMIGDAAAGASVDINEVSFWVGRAYAAIKGGQPFGEARMRLQELALLTPEAAQKMEKLQKAGASTAEVWSIMEGELGRFSGAMEKQAGTWDGLISTFADTVKLTLAGIFEPVFGALKGVLGTVNNFLSSPEAAAGFKAFGDAVAGIFEGIGAAVGWLLDIIMPLVSAFMDIFAPVDEGQAFLDSLTGNVKKANPVIATFAGLLYAVKDGLFAIIDAAMTVWGALGNIVSVFFDAGIASSEMEEALGGFGEALLGYWDTLASVVGDVVNQLGFLLLDLAGKFLAWVGPLIPPLLEALGQYAAQLLNWVLTVLIPQAQAAIGVLAGKFYSWVTDDVLPVLAKQVPLLFTAVMNWITEAIPPLLAKLAEVATAFIAWVGPQIPILLEELMKFLEAAVTWLAEVGIPTFVDSVLKWGAAIVEWVGPQIPPLLVELGKMLFAIGVWIITEGVPRLIGLALKLGEALIKGFLDMMFGRNGQKGLLALMVDLVTTALIPGFLRLYEDFSDAAGEWAGGIIGGFVDGIADGVAAIAKAIGDLFRSINLTVGPFSIKNGAFSVNWPDIKFPSIEIPGLAVGAWNIPRDMPAMLHSGEMVVPAWAAKALRGDGSQPAAVPRFPTGGGGGTLGQSSVVVNVTYSPAFSNGSPSERADFSRTIGDLLVAEFRSRGILPERAGVI